MGLPIWGAIIHLAVTTGESARIRQGELLLDRRGLRGGDLWDASNLLS